MSDQDEVVAMLVVPDEYIHHLGEVAGLTTRDLIFLRRKFVSRSGYELTRQPLDQCRSIEYFDERPLSTIISGVLLTGLILFVLVMLVVNWKDLEGGTTIPVGALTMAGAFGVQRIFRARRHRFVFVMQDLTKLSWASRSGEYSQWKASTDQILQFARSRRLMT